MRRLHATATAVLVALTTILLTACGPDDSTSASVDQSNAAANQATPSRHQTNAAATPPSALGALPALSTSPDAAAAAAASDSAVQSAQASLAADNTQVAPVLHYAPGDSDQRSSSN